MLFYHDDEAIIQADESEQDISRAYSSPCWTMTRKSIHIDTGATCAVTNLQGELHCPTPSTAQCGTAQHAAKVPITAVGTFIFDLIGRHRQLLPVEVPGACEIPGFSRHLLGLHALKNLGFSCGQRRKRYGDPTYYFSQW
jgi:hypothetical protein